FTSTAPSTILMVTPFGIVIGFFPIRDMSKNPCRLQAAGFGLQRSLAEVRSLGSGAYQILQSTSPPTPAFTASRPVITPRDVVRMLVPSPARTSGTSSLPK